MEARVEARIEGWKQGWKPGWRDLERWKPGLRDGSQGGSQDWGIWKDSMICHLLMHKGDPGMNKYPGPLSLKYLTPPPSPYFLWYHFLSEDTQCPSWIYIIYKTKTFLDMLRTKSVLYLRHDYWSSSKVSTRKLKTFTDYCLYYLNFLSGIKSQPLNRLRPFSIMRFRYPI